MLENGHGVLEVLQRFLQGVPPAHRDDHGHRPSALGDHQSVLAQAGQLLSDPVPKLGLGHDAARHALKRTSKRTLRQQRRPGWHGCDSTKLASVCQ